MEKNIKKFDQFSKLVKENTQEDKKVRVKDIINYLSKYDPETPVELDKNGWEEYFDTVDGKISMLISDSPIKNGYGDYLIINN